MSKQTFKIGNNAFPNILFWSASAALVLFGTLVLVSPTEVSTKALVNTTEYEDGLSIVTNATLNTTIHPEDSGTIVVAKDTVVGNTSSPHGYELYVSANSETINDIYLNGNTSLTETTKKIAATTATYDAPAALDITNGAAWGYAIAGLGSFDTSYDETNPTASAKFAAMPVIENKQLIHEVTTAATDDETEIYYGIKADSTLEPGLYKTEILYTAVPKPAPRVAKAILGDNGNLNLIYDNLTYTVGETYTDNLNTPTEITGVFDIPAGGILEEWHSLVGIDDTRDDVLSVNIDASFQDYTPSSTAYWFDWLTNVSSFTNIENLNTSAVRNMDHMFDGVGRGSNIATLSMGNIKSWDVSNVVSAESMFSSLGYNTANWTLDLDDWDLGSLRNMKSMFANAGYNSVSMTLILTDWNVPNVINMRETFDDAAEYAQSMNIDVSGWKLGSLQVTDDAFYQTGRYVNSFTLTGLSDWDMSTVSDVGTMFQQMGANVDDFALEITGWDLSSAASLSMMFDSIGYESSTWTVDVSGWTFRNNADLSKMFNYAGFGKWGTATDWTIDVTDWTFGSNPNLQYMFLDTGYNYDTWTMIGASTWNVDVITNFESLFEYTGYNSSSWDIGDLSGWDTGNATSMKNMFKDAGYKAGTNFTIGDISGWDVQQVTDHSYFMTTDSSEVPPHNVVQPAWPAQP